ncbi:MAG: hypothetical protein JOZ19_01590, partial [Rubrobacter sp.]|nr:hypothetical protein [Rubrobacter sp.]
AGTCAILVGITSFLYAVAFIVLQSVLLSGLFLMLSGLFTSAALVAVYQRLRETEADFALFALLLGLTGALGSAIHGGYDLANAINPPSSSIPYDLPNPVDPRGLLTFGVMGLALFIVALLIRDGGQFPGGLGYLGYVSAILLVLLYLGRLVVLNPSSALILVPTLLNGFLINPVFYLWLGMSLLRSGST